MEENLKVVWACRATGGVVKLAVERLKSFKN